VDLRVRHHHRLAAALAVLGAGALLVGLTPGLSASAPIATSAVAAPSVAPPPPPGVRIDPVADKHDFAILRADLGPDFAPRHGENSLAVRPGTESATGLPEGVGTELSMSAWYVYGGPPRTTICMPTRKSPKQVCAGHTLPSGKRYLVQRPSPVIDNTMPSVTVYFVRDSHVVVQVNLTTVDPAGSSRARKAATRRWTESMIARMAAAAADDRMEPWFYWPLRGQSTPPS
jgi:hypothetical protein